MADSPRTDPDIRDGAAVTTGALARRIGVSPTTLRSWDRRYGLGPAVRPDGRHRRWSSQDVAMVEHMCRLTATGIPPAEAARLAMASMRAATQGPGTAVTVSGPSRENQPGGGLPLGAARQECRGLARAAVRLDASKVQRQLNAWVSEYGLVVTWEEIMVPTLRAVGRKWESAGDRYVEVEHLLSWHVSTTLRSVPLLTPRPAVVVDSPPVVLACLPAEQHTLSLEALHAALGQRGVPTLMLGGTVPAEALLASVHRAGPMAVVLWSQSSSTADVPLAQRIARMEWGVKGARRHAMVLPAGPGWSGQAVPGLARCHGLRDAVALLHAACGGSAGIPPF
ncbi:MerR family transcriptional regulator [Streptomyces sp. NPDC047071]|uniref:MerR family transcriptional regulator n=1 Tax=Streptomyces sp. NPDC047071 TaxID=3154808 RepID=UPI0034552611